MGSWKKDQQQGRNTSDDSERQRSTKLYRKDARRIHIPRTSKGFAHYQRRHPGDFVADLHRGAHAVLQTECVIQPGGGRSTRRGTNPGEQSRSTHGGGGRSGPPPDRNALFGQEPRSDGHHDTGGRDGCTRD
jgi:hypothetical protein